MRYKVLLTGKGFQIIDDFFLKTSEHFECMTTSQRDEDIALHMRLFQPDALVYCAKDETKEGMLRVSAAKKVSGLSSTLLVVVGDREEVNAFTEVSGGGVDLPLFKPLSITKIQQEMLKMLKNRPREEKQGAPNTHMELEARAAAEAREAAEIEAKALAEAEALAEAAKKAQAEAEAKAAEARAASKARQEAAAKAEATAKLRAVSEGQISTEQLEEMAVWARNISTKQKDDGAAGDRSAADKKLTESVMEKRKDDKKHVLIIDDDPVMLKTLKLYLEDDYHIATALSGKIALKFLEKKDTDLILLDYEMPVMDGPEVITILRGNERTADIPIIFLTGVNEVDKIQKVMHLKPQGYMLKPVNNEDLHRTLKKWLK